MPMSIAAQAGSDISTHSSLASLIQTAASSTESSISADALSTKEVASYIRSLSNFSLADLRNQPQQLQSKSEALHNQLSELCISQTDAFIDIHQAEQGFRPFLDALSTHLDDLISNALPDLQRAAEAFEVASKPILAKRERLQNITDQYERGRLADLLEIPTLVHTCVRAAQYSEAIQLAEHLVGLLKRSDAVGVAGEKEDATTSTSDLNHGQRGTYLSLLIETLSHLSTMKDDLVSSFSSPNLKLPAARKSVAVLRRLSIFASQLFTLADQHSTLAPALSRPRVLRLGMSENQLCLAFLKARIRSFHSALDAVGSPASFLSEAYLRRYIDLWRDELADTLGMSFPLFLDEASSTSQTQISHESDPDMVTPAYLVSSFATSGLARLRDTVSVQLHVAVRRFRSSPSADSSLETLAETFANIHTQLNYASASLTRFGYDFGQLLFVPSRAAGSEAATPHLSSIEATWLDTLSGALDDVFAGLHSELDLHMQANNIALPSRWFTSSKLPRSALEDLYSVSADDADPSTYDDFTRPNIELVDYPSFAKLLNQLMEWLNALQVFAPVALSTILVQKLDSHFASITRRLLTQLPEVIAKLDTKVPHADQLLADEEARTFLQYLDEDPEAKRELQSQLVKDRESAILGKVIGMWHNSVVAWTLHVIRSQVFELAEESGVSEADAVWNRVKDWNNSTRSDIMQSNKQRQHAATERQRAHNEAVEAARVKAEDEARVQAEEDARRRAEEEDTKLKAEEARRFQAEEEARQKAETEARRVAEAEAQRKVEEQARKKAEEQARLKAAEEEARRKAEIAARLKAEEEGRMKAEAEAKRRAEEEREQQIEADKLKAADVARLKAEQEAEEAAATKKAAEEEAIRKKDAEDEAARKKAATEDAANRKAEELKTEAAKKKQDAEVAARARADELIQAQAAEKKTQDAVGAIPDESAQADTKDAEIASHPTADVAAPRAQPEAQSAGEPQAEPSLQTPAKGAEQRGSSPAPKKFSLADKLRQRKEERDRAAAASAAKAPESKEAPAFNDEGTAEAPATAAPSSSNAAAEDDQTAELTRPEPEGKKESGPEAAKQVVQQEQSDSQLGVTGVTEVGESEQKDTDEPSDLQPDAVGTVKAEPVTSEALEDEDEDEDDKGDGAEEGSGANTPATPTTPNPSDGNVGSASKKNKKKNKKKKK